MESMISLLTKKICRLFRSRKLCPMAIYNINFAMNRAQKRVAYIYILDILKKPVSNNSFAHANRIHALQFLDYFIQEQYVIDFYDCSDRTVIDNSSTKYDLIFGFGKPYLELCSNHPDAKKVLFLTENAPWIVSDKFSEREAYYYERHKKKIFTYRRRGYYNKEMFDVSDRIIALNGTYNIDEIKKLYPNIYATKTNGIFDSKFNLPTHKNHSITKYHFLWFGSKGSIHKGLDILIDVFGSIETLELDLYGVPNEEIKEFRLPPNIHNCGFINVLSDNFLRDVVSKHTFVISLSCSEGMQSSISTCMHYGLIPIVTRECGFDDAEGVIILKDFHVNYVKEKILEVCSFDELQIRKMEETCFDYARKHLTVNSMIKDIDSVFKSF